MSILEEVRSILAQTLQLEDKAEALEPSTHLLGSIPELDSMAVVAVITGLEERFDIVVEDDEISAETFETVGSLCDFVESKV
jgi:acyl carrier protein